MIKDKIIDKVIAIVKNSGVTNEVGPMETTMEGDIDMTDTAIAALDIDFLYWEDCPSHEQALKLLEEVVRVRAEMGYPILVTPVSQLVAYQATRNVIDPERWQNVSDESVVPGGSSSSAARTTFSTSLRFCSISSVS